MDRVEGRRVETPRRALGVRVEKRFALTEARRRLELADRLRLIAGSAFDDAVDAGRKIGRAAADDVHDAAHAIAPVFGWNRSGIELERVDDLGVDDLGEVGGRRQRQRRAVDVIGDAVEAVDHRFVVGEGHDAGQRLQSLVEAILHGRRLNLIAIDLVNRRRITRDAGVRRDGRLGDLPQLRERQIDGGDHAARNGDVDLQRWDVREASP